MEIEKLVERITAEVLKYIYGNGNKDLIIEQKRILILDQEGALIKKQIADNTKISMEQMDDLTQFSLNNRLDQYEWVVVPALTIKELTHISLGIRDGMVCELISDGILTGKKIFVLAEGLEYRKYEATSSSKYYSMLKTYEEKLVDFGIQIVNSFELYGCFQEKLCSKFQDKASIYKERRKVIIESHLEQLYLSGHNEIQIDKRAIITPLAVDFIKAKGMRIVRQRE